MMKPFVKWAGGKRQILNFVLEKIKASADPNDNGSFTFYEPFVGGGTIFLSLERNKTVINDLNFELITAYRVVKEQPYALMKRLDKYFKDFKKGGEQYYYKVRKEDQNPNFKKKNKVEIAARMIFLNKTCYNGLYRVNSSGYFNTPIGRNKIRSFYEKENILAISKYLNGKNVRILNSDYRDSLKYIRAGDVIYMDPPYDYKEDDGFTQYQKNGFSYNDLLELRKECDRCLDKEATVLISNNKTAKVLKAFENDNKHKYGIFSVESLSTKRNINCKGNLRNTGEEILIWGFPCKFPMTKKIHLFKNFIKIKTKNNIKNFEFLEKRFKKECNKTEVRQIVAALSYLGIIGTDDCFSDLGIKMGKLGETQFNKKLACLLVSKPPFSNVYEQEICSNKRLTEEKIASDIYEEVGISNRVARKRATVVRIWVDWAKDVLN